MPSPEEVYLLHNAIYAVGKVPAVVCKLPHPALRTQKAVQQFTNAFLDCLQRAWQPLVDGAGVAYIPTKAYAVARNAKTGCGTIGADDDAFYCPQNNDIYLDWRGFVVGGDVDQLWAESYVEFVVAHEFGHHVQQLVGISTYYDARWEAAKGAAQLEQTRRHELQATCFAGAFLGANQKTLDLYGAHLEDYRDAAYVGDEDSKSAPHDHGSRKSATAWSNAAFKAKSPSACNTWVVPANKVT
jgi:hypothetical protein